MITSLADAIWQAIQRPSPPVTKEEIYAIVVEHLAEPSTRASINERRHERIRQETQLTEWTPEEYRLCLERSRKIMKAMGLGMVPTDDGKWIVEAIDREGTGG